MNKKLIPVFILSVFISLLLCGTAFSVCYEATGGKLQSGSIASYIPSILQSYEKDVPNGAVYTVQKKQGFYFKICDEANQIKPFMEKWAYPEISNGDWQSILTTRDSNKIDIIQKVGVYKVEKNGSDWNVYKYAKKGSLKTKLFLKTVPSNARIRILNIKPKFFQGIPLQPGSYHLEISAKGYSPYKKWVELKEGKNETIKIKLNPALPIQLASNPKRKDSKKVNGKCQFTFRDAIVTVNGYKWTKSLGVETTKLDLKEIKTIENVIYPRNGYKLISFQCIFSPKTSSKDVKFKNTPINLYVNGEKSNLVLWYLSFGSPSNPMKMGMSSISTAACKAIRPVVVFVVPNSVSGNDIAVGTNIHNAHPINNINNLNMKKI